MEPRYRGMEFATHRARRLDLGYAFGDCGDDAVTVAVQARLKKMKSGRTVEVVTDIVGTVPQ